MAAVFLAAILFFPFRVNALSAERAIVMDADSGHVLYERESDSRSLIASTTKIMTALIVCEQCNVLDRVRIPDEAVGIEGSSIYLKAGEVLTVQELLYGLMLHSGNDAAVALAIYCGGTVEGFSQLMNDKAHMLKMYNSHFANPHGLDAPNHYSSARDLAVLTAYAMKNPIFQQTVSTKHVNITGRSLRNHNKLLWRLEGADGVKTGFTKAAGRILVSSALRNGRRLVAVTINAPNDWSDHALLMNASFSDYAELNLVHQGDPLATVAVNGGEADNVTLLAAQDVSCSIAVWEDPRVVIKESGPIFAPVIRGQAAGNAFIYIDDAVIGAVPLVFGETVERKNENDLSFWDKLLGRDRQ